MTVLESGAREETGRLTGTSKDVSRPGIEPGSQELASCAITTAARYHATARRRAAFDVFQGSCYTILLPSARHPAPAAKPSAATSVTGVDLESGAREETGRFRDVKRCVATGDRNRVSGKNARPPQHDTTGPRHRAFDVFQGSCYRRGGGGGGDRLAAINAIRVQHAQCTSGFMR